MQIGKMVRGLALTGMLALAPCAWAEDAPARDFNSFIADFRTEALAAGLRPEIVALLDGVQPIDRIIELDRRQPEFSMPFDRYVKAIETPQRIAKGRKLMVQNGSLLKAIEQRYGVQARFVVALWGIESGFGVSMGSYPVLASMATLAWDGRRSAYFRGELLNALKILDAGYIRPDEMRGSWAGAMGQCQFMPSTYLKYAQDWHGSGRRDIWHDRGDALASAANYLSSIGWKGDEGWGRPVSLPAKLDPKVIGLDTRKSLTEWGKLGVRAANGKPLPSRAQEASLVIAAAKGASGPAFLVTDNFRLLMQWNRSTFFALAAGQLADRIGRR